MADVDVLGGPDHVGAVYAAAVAMRELRLSSDPTAPVQIRQAAGALDTAVLDLRDAVDLAVELEEAGVRQRAVAVPEAGSAEDRELDKAPRPVWAAYRDLEASLGDLLATINALPPMSEESSAYRAAVERIGSALAAARWQHVAAADFAQDGMPLRVVGSAEQGEQALQQADEGARASTSAEAEETEIEAECVVAERGTVTVSMEPIDDTAMTPGLADEIAEPSQEAMVAQDKLQAEASTGAEMAAEPSGSQPSGSIESE
jgi:hypothetical protein